VKWEGKRRKGSERYWERKERTVKEAEEAKL
jgi:hypothetical protein